MGNTAEIKKGVLDAFLALLPEFSQEELEVVEDQLALRLHRLSDDGVRYTLDDVKIQLGLDK